MPVGTASPDIETEDTSGHSPSRTEDSLSQMYWSPHAHDRGVCHCGHFWNTFDTGGVCPACLYQWTMTACLSCRQWSPHSDWYVTD
ncbi:MAG: hypothetical protein JOY54_04145 [Acidobacteriaceae bacterium]|nr:hypothetical protein [Acidobacteriaceae bacterium]